MGHGRSRILQFIPKHHPKVWHVNLYNTKTAIPPGSLENPFKADVILLEAMYVPTCKYI